MTLPIDLVLIRHGQSEGNLAKKLSKDGNNASVDILRDRHTARYRLTKKGRRQAQGTGIWLRNEFGDLKAIFDIFLVSEYIRAVETAGLLNIPHAQWTLDFNLRERVNGNSGTKTEEERRKALGEALKVLDAEPYFWAPPGAESYTELCERLRIPLAMLHRECESKRVLCVCHGEVMWGFRILLERLSQDQFKKLHISEKDFNRIHNGQVLHYTRRNPETGRMADHANWLRMVRPTEDPVWDSGWQEIARPFYSNKDLLKIARRVPLLVEK